MDAREAALLTLNTCERQGGWSDGALKKQLAAGTRRWRPSCASGCFRTSCFWIFILENFPISH